jgi:hypothetical protein
VSKRPPANTTGKLALAGKLKQARQTLDREQRELDRRDLLSLVGKNSSIATSWPETVTGHAMIGMPLASPALRRLTNGVRRDSKSLCGGGAARAAAGW